MQTVYDVIVVGGGGSGLAAAVSAAEHGCDVLLLEKQPALGGTTGIAVGSFTANQTALQNTAGIADDLDAHAEDAGQFAPADIEARNNAELRRFFLSHTAETLNWLSNLGLSFYGPSPEPPNRVARMHNVIPAAKAYIATLQARLLKLGGTIRCRAAVKSLHQPVDRVEGVEAVIKGGKTISFRAKRGVVLAAGDYANAPEIIARMKGEQFARIEGINPNAGGDGHLLAQAAGAQLLNMDVTYGPELRFIPPPGKTFHQLLPASGPIAKLMGKAMAFTPKFIIHALIKRLLVTWQHPENALFDNGAILINQHGQRFCDEKVWPDREIALAHQPDKQAYILLDQRLAELYSKWPNFISTAPKIAYAYVKDYLKLRPDIAISASTIDVAAESRGLSSEAIYETVKNFNRGVRRLAGDPFGRTGDAHELKGNRWALLGPARAWFTTTEGGAAIDERLQALDEHGLHIPGLYAVGQNGLGGQILWGHGLHIAWALTSGRLVGKVLGSEAPDADAHQLD
ncbi:MAG: succinate dehydrogenase/fumarate reductase flavoprotein subunit [Limisphaerales bacterium]|jgi:succinate dehydrogenase/fumarate reductase flavoprotein subunit